jgi:nitroreductase
MRRRVSTRSYARHPVAPALIDHLLAHAAAASHLTPVPPRIALVDGAEQARCVLTFVIGSYGLVQNPPHLLVGVMPEESEVARLDLGYVLEQVVLEATGLGLGTCWITGSYDAESAGDAVGLQPGEVAAAVCALGHPDSGRASRIHDVAIRWLARGHRRKPLTEIVFDGRWGEPWSPAGVEASFVSMLEHARIAPSATNRQPWRFVLRPGGLVLALVRPAPIDAGIVMAHVALAASALGIGGGWEVQLRDTTLAEECGLPAEAIVVGAFR